MPDVRISEPMKERINRQPERRYPHFLSFNKTTAALVDEALERRRALLKAAPKLKKKG